MATIHLTAQDFKDRIFDYETSQEWKFKGDLPAIVDFYADWCAPCKKMKPYLEEIEKEMSETVKIVRINVEENKPLCKGLGIEVLPTIEIYKDGVKKWKDTGYKSKAELLKQLK